MAAGSIIGFAMVFVLVAWTSSALAALVLTRMRPMLGSLGSAAEKRAAAIALILPPLLGAIVAACLAAYSAYPGWLGSADHCESHLSHLHLCVVHGGQWATRPWPLALVFALTTLALFRLARLGKTMLRGHRRVRLVQGASTRVLAGDIPVYCTPSERHFCFVTGMRSPRVFVASSLWESSSPSQREAILGHEYSHVQNGDLWRSVVLSLCGFFGAPYLAAHFHRLWGEACERLCDRLTADRSGDSESVATALLHVARGHRAMPAMAFMPKPESVNERIVAVLSQERTGHFVARRLLQGTAALVTISVMALAALADPIHHALETLLALV